MKKIYFIITSVLILLSNLNYAQKLQWAKQLGGTTLDYSNSIAIDDSGNVYVTGMFTGTADFDPGPGIFNLTSIGLTDLFVQKLNSTGNLVWAKQIGSTYDDFAYCIAVDDSGNVYTSGNFQGKIDLDPGSDSLVVNNPPSGGINMFIQKLDVNGDLVWAHAFGSSGNDNMIAIAFDKNQNVYTTGSFGNDIDMDPGPGVFTLPSGGVNCEGIFIQKLDAAGNFIWAKKMSGGSSSMARGMSISVDPYGNVYTTGKFDGGFDFDPGSGILTLSSSAQDIFIQKLDASGNLVWAKKIGGSSDDAGNSIAIDPNGFIYTTGYFQGTFVDFDPGPGSFKFSSGGNQDIFVQKMDFSGNFIWAKRMGGGGLQIALSIALDPSGNVYTTGWFAGTPDFDPGPGTSNLISAGGDDAFISKLDPMGNFLWAKQIGGISSEVGRSIKADPLGNIYITGLFANTVDFDPDTSIFNLTSTTSSDGDIFVTKWSQDSCSNLVVIVDSALNLTCSNPGYAAAHVLNGLAPYTFNWNTLPPTTTANATFDSARVYTLTVTDANSCMRNSFLLINGPLNTSAFDLNVNLIASSFRPGFFASLFLDAFNDGCIVTSGKLSLVLDTTLVKYYYSYSPPDTIIGDTLIWNYITMNYDSAHVKSRVFLTLTTAASIGDQICFDAIITPVSGDLNPTSNIKHYCYPVINGYDPNDKQVYPKGECVPGYILNNQLLTYTVRFQNTGNADAINIHILDSLDAGLDLNTVRIIGKSHEPLITEVLPGNVLNFRFDNINLADSTSNEIGSHGYVIFAVSPKTSLSSGTIVKNQADIYFDYNAPIYTNNVSNTIVNVIPSVNTSVTQSENTFTANTNGASYQWIDCNNGKSIINGENNQSYTAIDNGSYAVIIIENGCTDTSSCYSINSVDIEKDDKKLFYIYPNPINDNSFYIDFGKTYSTAKIEITDIVGKIIFIEQLNGPNKAKIILNGPSGIYFMNIHTNENKYTVKLIKQ